MFWSAGHEPSRTCPPGDAEYHGEWPLSGESGENFRPRNGTIRYRAFGQRFTVSGADPSRLDPSFQGRTYDAGLGIYDYRNRTFDPCTGRSAPGCR